MTIALIGFSIHEPLPSSSPIKRNHGESPSTSVEGGYPKRAHLSEGFESEALTYFFQLSAILPTQVPSTLEEFVVVVANEDLAFFWSLSVTDRLGFFVDASRTLFRVRYLVSMVAIG